MQENSARTRVHRRAVEPDALYLVDCKLCSVQAGSQASDLHFLVLTTVYAQVCSTGNLTVNSRVTRFCDVVDKLRSVAQCA